MPDLPRKDLWGLRSAHAACVVPSHPSEDSGYRGSPPWQLVQGLEQKRLVISDLEIADEDIHVLVKFFQSKKVCIFPGSSGDL